MSDPVMLDPVLVLGLVPCGLVNITGLASLISPRRKPGRHQLALDVRPWSLEL